MTLTKPLNTTIDPTTISIDPPACFAHAPEAAVVGRRHQRPPDALEPLGAVVLAQKGLHLSMVTTMKRGDKINQSIDSSPLPPPRSQQVSSVSCGGWVGVDRGRPMML
jgi:hypothetical protein